VHRADGVPRPAKPARQTFRSVSASRWGDVSAARRTLAAQGLNVCRAGFAGRGTACARSTERHTLASVPTRDKGLGSV